MYSIFIPPSLCFLLGFDASKSLLTAAQYHIGEELEAYPSRTYKVRIIHCLVTWVLGNLVLGYMSTCSSFKYPSGTYKVKIIHCLGTWYLGIWVLAHLVSTPVGPTMRESSIAWVLEYLGT